MGGGERGKGKRAEGERDEKIVPPSTPQDCWPKEGKRGPESSPKVLRPSTRVVTVPFPLPREIAEKYSKSSRVILFLGGALRAPPKRVLFEYFSNTFLLFRLKISPYRRKIKPDRRKIMIVG